MRNGKRGREAGREASVWIRSTYGAIGRAPHLLQLEFFHALLVWRDGRALDADIVLENRLGRFDCYFIIGLGTRAWWIRRDSRVWVGTQIGIA
jgi:hypothetical protein